MSTTSTGLQTHIWNNNLKTIILLAAYPFLILGIVWACALALSGSLLKHSGQQIINAYTTPYGEMAQTPIYNPYSGANSFIAQYCPLIFTAVAVWFLIAYFFHNYMIRKLSHSSPVSRMDEPELYNLVENLAISTGMTMPRLEIIETHARNAFASGIDQKSFSITVTRGLMNSLTRDELEGVLAHELTHILNRDVRLLIVTIIFTGMIGFALQMVWSNVRYGYIFHGNRRNGGGIIVILAIALVLWIGYIATLFTRFAISRNREYMADAGAVKLTKNPEAMMRALMRISGRADIPETTDDIAMMCIENANPFLGMFATHPPIEKRIRALSEITNTPIPQLSIPPASKAERFNTEFKNPWLVRERGKRKLN